MSDPIKVSEVTAMLRQQLADIDNEENTLGNETEVGTVLTVSDGVVRAYGLRNAEAGELLQFDNGMEAIVMNLEEDNVGAVLLGPTDNIEEGDIVKRTGRIASIAVRAMAGHYGFAPSSLCAVIGPSISQAAFEVGDEVYDAFRGAGFDMDEIAVRIGEKWHIDLWRANEQELTAAGVRAERIHTAGICTWTRHNDFFSARREGIRSGRIFSGLIIKS